MTEPGLVEAANRRVVKALRRLAASRVRYWLVQLRRKLPYLVWYNDEVDLTMTLIEHKLNPDDPFASLFTGSAAEVVQAFRNIGIGFDTGCGEGGYDLELDWSLKGPISCRFRGRAKEPGRRKSRPRPELAIDNTKPAA